MGWTLRRADRRCDRGGLPRVCGARAGFGLARAESRALAPPPRRRRSAPPSMPCCEAIRRCAPRTSRDCSPRPPRSKPCTDSSTGRSKFSGCLLRRTRPGEGSARLRRRDRQSALGNVAAGRRLSRAPKPFGFLCPRIRPLSVLRSRPRQSVSTVPRTRAGADTARGGRVGLILPWGLAVDEGAARRSDRR